PTQVKTDSAFSMSDESISVSLEAKSVISDIPSSLPKRSPEQGTIQQETTKEKTTQKSKKDSKVKRKYKEPDPNYLNIPAYAAAALSIVSLISIPLDLGTGGGLGTLIAFLLSIPILALGYEALEREKKKKSNYGKGLAIFALITGYVLTVVGILAAIIVILMILAVGFGNRI
ncbi:MAG: DUF4190 domain-containing protein, partial [Bacteroidia bacterium]|nr:DUF4190 domain-containing protein [Bacteroidia bacterium]